MFCFCKVNPGVVHIHLGVVVLQGFDDVHHFGVAHVGAVFFERQAQHQHFAAQNGQALAQHKFDGLVCHVAGHAVVDAPARQNDLRVITNLLRLVRQVVRVHANAVASHKTGAEGQKVPFGASSLQHFERVNAQLVKDEAELVHESDIDVTLGVLNHLGCLGHFDATGFMGAGGDDLLIKLVHLFGYCGGAATGDFFDAG